MGEKKTKKRRYFPGQDKVEQQIKALYPGADSEEKLVQYYTKKKKGLLIILIVGAALTLLLLISANQNRKLVENRFLPREEETYEKAFELQIEGEEARELWITVEPRHLSEKESRDLVKNVKEQLTEYILGENDSLDEVRNNLLLVTEVEGLPVKITWELDSYEVLNPDGSIRQDNLKEEGAIVGLTAHLVCNDEVELYQAYAKVLPPLVSEQEKLEKELQKELARYEEETKEAQQKELPQEISGKTLSWKEKDTQSAPAILGLTLLCMFLFYFSEDEKIKQCVQEREQQMQRDYARMVSKLVLLMGAGMTIRNSWEQIVRDYQRKRREKQIDIHYVYEEMALTCYEIQSGIAESKAYENFGNRCGVACYFKLAALLEQNLKKGNRGLSALLKMEVQDAFTQRKELARIQGERAATNLLIPMILLLMVVMILILVPAGLSMQM